MEENEPADLPQLSVGVTKVLRSLQGESRLKDGKLAEEAGMDRNKVQRLLTESQTLTVNDMDYLARALKCDVLDLLARAVKEVPDRPEKEPKKEKPEKRPTKLDQVREIVRGEFKKGLQ